MKLKLKYYSSFEYSVGYKSLASVYIDQLISSENTKMLRQELNSIDFNNLTGYEQGGLLFAFSATSNKMEHESFDKMVELVTLGFESGNSEVIEYAVMVCEKYYDSKALLNELIKVDGKCEDWINSYISQVIDDMKPYVK